MAGMKMLFSFLICQVCDAVLSLTPEWACNFMNGMDEPKTKALVAVLLALLFALGATAQVPRTDAAGSFFRSQGLLQPPASNGMAFPQVRAPNLPDQAKAEKFDTLTVNGVTYTNVLLRSINASQGALHHDGGLAKVRLGDLPEPVRIRFCDPATLRIVGGHALSTNGWIGLSGEVSGLLTNGILLRLEGQRGSQESVFVACDPRAEGFYDGQPLSICAQGAGVAYIEGKSLPAYDAGLRYKTQ